MCYKKVKEEKTMAIMQINKRRKERMVAQIKEKRGYIARNSDCEAITKVMVNAANENFFRGQVKAIIADRYEPTKNRKVKMRFTRYGKH